MTTSVGNNSVFKSFFKKQKLTGPNFIDWYRQLHLVLSTEDKEKYLEQPIPTAPVPAAPDQPIPPAALATYNEWTVRDFHKCKQEEGQSVSSYVLKMKSYIDQLERLGHPVTLNLGVSLILVGLSKEYDSFVQNYNTHSMGKTVNELHDMLKLHEEKLPNKVAAHALHAIRAEKVQKNKNKKSSKDAKGVQGKGKGKKAYDNAEPSYAPKPKNPPLPKKDNPSKDAICHHRGEGLRGSKKLNPGALSLYMGNGQRAAVEAIGNYHLCLPSGLVIILNNCHYAPSITRGIISVSRLYEDGFINRFELNNAIFVSKSNIVYFSAIPRDGVYEIEMSCSNTNDSSMCVVSNKKAKLNLDSSLLWHCCLGYISKKRIKKLQHDELLKSTNIESLGKCVSCMSGKMARKPYSHQVERAKDLLGLIHTDVCGPFRIVSRQGANYFITFTDDFSRYGYVYLLKHKHEVFETFKVFQKEVENQLGKTIKSLRFDRGGEYMSQKFLDHLKEHGIIAHHTLPYTPQHNRVSERRNRTLLDMVPFMMSQTTLPKSFLDYALEYAARIFNMVPTKKVDKTPYEIWHGQAPKLSYLKVWGCEALVKRDILTKPDKLEPRSFKCIFIGYPKEMMGYSFYNPSENKVFVARNDELFKSNLIDQEASGSLEDLEIIQEEDTNPSLDTSLDHE
ncbi:retrotransposon protein, putative, ty1-copia subclass [Tanacetum coccineum]